MKSLTITALLLCSTSTAWAQRFESRFYNTEPAVAPSYDSRPSYEQEAYAADKSTAVCSDCNRRGRISVGYGGGSDSVRGYHGRTLSGYANPSGGGFTIGGSRGYLGIHTNRGGAGASVSGRNGRYVHAGSNGFSAGGPLGRIIVGPGGVGGSFRIPIRW